jgi:hypothetical protein
MTKATDHTKPENKGFLIADLLFFGIVLPFHLAAHSSAEGLAEQHQCETQSRKDS